MSFLNENLNFQKCQSNIKNQQNSIKEDRLIELGENSAMEAGTRVGAYCLGTIIGKGNFSVVRLATHLPTGMRVAVKILHKTKMSPETLEKTYREVQIMKQLHHGNIVQLYQVIESTNWLFICMEYVSRGELFDYLSKTGRLKESDARTKFRQILDAVEYCHTMNIVHRDLKAENLLMDENFNIKLVDFGFGSFYNTSYLLSTWCGSPPYAAPELFRGEPYIGPKADIWSLGVVLYVMVCGVLPFNEPCSIVKLREQVLKSLVRFPYFLSYECEHLIRIILNRDPAKRPSISYIKDHTWVKNPIYNSSSEGQCNESIITQGRSSRRCNTVCDDSGFDVPVDFTKHNIDKFRLSISHDYMDRDINEDVLQIIERCGITRSSVIKELSLNIYGPLTATYLLLCVKLKSSRQIQSSFTLSNFLIKNDLITQAIIPNQEYKVISQTSICQIDSSIKGIQIDESKGNSKNDRSSPYDNINPIENKNRPSMQETINLDHCSRPQSQLSETFQANACLNYINCKNVASVIIDLVLPHNDDIHLYSQGHKNLQRIINYPPEIAMYYHDQTSKKESNSSPSFSNTCPADIEKSKSQIKSVTPTCCILSPSSIVQPSQFQYIPRANNGVINGQLISLERHKTCHPHSNDIFPISSIYDKSNNPHIGHASYGYSSPIANLQLKKLFEVPLEQDVLNQNKLQHRNVILQHFNKAQNYDLAFYCENQNSNKIKTQNFFSNPEPKAFHYQCHLNDSMLSENRCISNNQNEQMIPISNHIQRTTKPNLSSIHKSLSSYPETCLNIIPRNDISRVSRLSSVNTNIIKLS